MSDSDTSESVPEASMGAEGGKSPLDDSFGALNISDQDYQLPNLPKSTQGDKQDSSETSKSAPQSPSRAQASNGKNKTREQKTTVRRSLYPSTCSPEQFNETQIDFQNEPISLSDFLKKLEENETKKERVEEEENEEKEKKGEEKKKERVEEEENEEKEKKGEEKKKEKVETASTSNKHVLDYFMKAIVDKLGKLSIDLDTVKDTAGVFKHINDVNSSVNEAITETMIMECKMKQPDRKMIRLMSQFRTAVNEFMRSCIDVVHSTIHNPRAKPESGKGSSPKDQKLPEILYETLFTSFSKMFLLNPRQQRSTYTRHFGKDVSSRPDLHFEQTFNPSKKDTKQRLVMISEVKRDKPGDDIFKKFQNTPKKIDSMTKQQVIMQIGLSLLTESPYSYISPVVVGILCLRSEILFLLLDITQDHVNAIEGNEPESMKDKKACIYYTEAFDILKPKGREAVRNIMFHMASIQTDDFNDLL